MSALDEPGYNMPETEGRRCKRDYERLIKVQKDRNQASANLYDSLMAYIEAHGAPTREKTVTIQHLLGALLIELRVGALQVDQLIHEQEKEKE
jgi:hypothetical protein